MEENPHGQSMTTEYLLSEPGLIRLEGRCEHPDCQNTGERYEYPREVGETDPPFVIACPVHVKYFGFCYRCRGYARGNHNFDYCDYRLCDSCIQSLSIGMATDDPMVDYDDLDY